jgi:hypothetical protein
LFDSNFVDNKKDDVNKVGRPEARMTAGIRIVKHEVVPRCGSYEVRFSNGGIQVLLLGRCTGPAPALGAAQQ